MLSHQFVGHRPVRHTCNRAVNYGARASRVRLVGYHVAESQESGKLSEIVVYPHLFRIGLFILESVQGN